MHAEGIKKIIKFNKTFKNYKIYSMTRKIYKEMANTYRKSVSRPSEEMCEAMFIDIRRPIPWPGGEGRRGGDTPSQVNRLR